INRDFADIRAVMRGGGLAVLGTAVARGENAAVEAARQAINCPLVEGASIAGARNVLVHVTGSSRLGIHELHEACSLVREATRCPEAEVSFGIVLNETMADAVKVSVIATGFTGTARQRDASSGDWLSLPAPEPAVQASLAPEPAAVAADSEFAARSSPSSQPYFDPAGQDEEDDLEDLDTPPFLRRFAR
ncbi:MAG: cell division protein FtsZ, partial [Bryobacteraceae bacterium]